jgi:hypothetical protein
MNTSKTPVFYKYRDDSTRTEDIFLKGKVWLSTARKLNDPLECKTGQIPEEWKKKNIYDMENAHMSGFLMSAIPVFKKEQPFYSLSNRAAKRWFQKFKRLKTRKEKYTEMRSFLEDHGTHLSRPADLFKKFETQLLQVGIFSLSECPDNALMWAHYGSSHTGIAIGFASVPAAKLFSSEHTLQVIYSNSKPIFENGFINKISMASTQDSEAHFAQKIGFNDPTFRAAFSTKPVEWNYEKEWRYVEETSGPFPWPGPITTIVFGLKMPNARRRHYTSLVRRHVPNSVEFFEIVTSLNNSSFAVIPWSPK